MNISIDSFCAFFKILFASLLTFVPIMASANVCARTPEVVRQLQRMTGLPCAEIGNDHLASVKWLDFRDDPIHEGLRQGDFDGLSQVEEMRLRGESIFSFPDRIFEPLENLKQLQMAELGLKAISADIFRKNNKLRKISLAQNRLESLPGDLFGSTPLLRDLSLHGNQLTSVPENLFDGLALLEGLSLGIEWPNNPIQNLSRRHFRDLSKLRYLILDGMRLKTIPKDLLQDLRSLQKIYLSENDFLEIPEGLFAGLTHLATVDIARCRSLVVLPGNLFQDNKKMISIDISQNIIEVLPATLFRGLIALNKLSLYDNRLRELNADSFEDLSALETLNLGNNSLAVFEPQWFVNQRNLAFLILSHNKIQSLPDRSFASLEKLRRLFLEYNQIRSVHPNSFQGLKSLQELDLRHNLIEFFPPGVFDNLSAKLFLWGNPACEHGGC